MNAALQITDSRRVALRGCGCVPVERLYVFSYGGVAEAEDAAYAIVADAAKLTATAYEERRYVEIGCFKLVRHAGFLGIGFGAGATCAS